MVIISLRPKIYSLLVSGSSKLEFVNANLHEQSYLQHSLFPASACDFCESNVANG